MNKVVFWDWTGTLVDERVLDKAVCETMEEMCAKNNSISLEEAAKRFNNVLKGLEYGWEWHDYAEHGRKLGVDWKAALSQNLDKLIVLPHAKEILEYAKNRGYANCLATNAVRSVILLRLKQSGLEKCFDLVIASDDIKAIKSEGTHFKFGLEKLGADPKLSFSIGDNPVQDIIPAKKLAMKTVFCSYCPGKTHYHTEHIYRQHFMQNNADHVIQNLEELRNIFV